MANEKKPVSHAHSGVGPKTAGMRPFDAAGQYRREKTAEDAARLPGLSPEMVKEHVTDYHEKLAEYRAKHRGPAEKKAAAELVSSATDTATSKKGTR